MNSWKALTVLAVAGALGVLLYFGSRRLTVTNHNCDICGRERHAHLQAAVFLKDGKRVEACCPRCALHYEIHRPGDIARMTVEDALTGGVIEAQSAVYLEGSDAGACHPEAGNVPREPGVAYEIKFDRCLPNLVAFRSHAEARAFQKEHGGKLLSYAQAVESVRQR